MRIGADRLAGSVCDFVRTCAGTVIAFGLAAFEILALRQEEDRKVIRAFDLAWIPPFSLRRVAGLVFQRLPRESREAGSRLVRTNPEASGSRF